MLFWLLVNRFADEQVKTMLASGPADREMVERAIERCVRAADLRWHGNVVWVDSPFVVPVIATADHARGYHDSGRKLIDDVFVHTLRKNGYHNREDLSPVGREAFDLVDHEHWHGALSTWRSIIERHVRWGVDPALAAETRAVLATAADDGARRLFLPSRPLMVPGRRERRREAGRQALLHSAVHRMIDPDAAGPLCDRCRQAPRGRRRLAREAQGLRNVWANCFESGNFDIWWRWRPWIAALAAEEDEGRVPAAMGAELRAYAEARSAGPWRLLGNLVVVSERLHELHVEMAVSAGHDCSRLHRADGPAIRTADGRALWFVHGRAVKEWVIEAPTVERIASEPNIEVRRIAIERLGWDRFVADAGLSLVATAPDPGVAGTDIALYDMPARWWGDDLRLAVVTNGTPERDGTRRCYGIPVPAAIRDPIEAIAWSYDVSVEAYAGIARRT